MEISRLVIIFNQQRVQRRVFLKKSINIKTIPSHGNRKFFWETNILTIPDYNPSSIFHPDPDS